MKGQTKNTVSRALTGRLGSSGYVRVFPSGGVAQKTPAPPLAVRLASKKKAH
jgi:hypothetical protein